MKRSPLNSYRDKQNAAYPPAEDRPGLLNTNAPGAKQTMNDSERIRFEGDELERHYAEKILARIPSYAVFWVRFIGNDGENKSLPMPGASAALLETRAYLWKHLYTLFESLALSWRLEDVLSENEVIATPLQYADNQNAWIAFYAHLGRIRDMAEKASARLGSPRLVVPFSNFYARRNTVLHYPSLPMDWIENLLVAPLLSEDPERWRKTRWEEPRRGEFDFLGRVISRTLRGLEPVVEGFLAQAIRLAVPRLSFADIQWPDVCIKSSRRERHPGIGTTIRPGSSPSPRRRGTN